MTKSEGLWGKATSFKRAKQMRMYVYRLIVALVGSLLGAGCATKELPAMIQWKHPPSRIDLVPFGVRGNINALSFSGDGQNIGVRTSRRLPAGDGTEPI